jgi:nitrogen fixation protein NifU and related proteins
VTVVDDLYRTVVLEHGKRPRHRGPVAQATHAAEGDNPLCGDALRVEIALRDDVLVAVGFTGESCAIATASASLMSEQLAGLTPAETSRLADAMESLCTTGASGDAERDRLLGELLAFAEVHRHPVRVACATLAWRIMRRALSGD